MRNNVVSDRQAEVTRLFKQRVIRYLPPDESSACLRHLHNGTYAFVSQVIEDHCQLAGYRWSIASKRVITDFASYREIRSTRKKAQTAMERAYLAKAHWVMLQDALGLKPLS